MARIGDYIQPGLNSYDPSPYLQAQGNATRTIGTGIANAVGDFGDVLKEQREKKNEVKANSKLIESYMTLFPDSAKSLEGIKNALADEDAPISERHAIAKTTGDLIGAYLDKSRSDALMGIQVQQLAQSERSIGLDERRVQLAEALPKRQEDAALSQAAFENESMLNESMSRGLALAEVEKTIPNLPDMTASGDLISKFIQQGDGKAALKAVEAREKILAPYLGPQTLNPTKIGGMDTEGNPIQIDALISPQGAVFDIQGQPLNGATDTGANGSAGVLPPKIGVTPSGSRPTPQTPAQAKLDELKVREMEGQIQGQAAALDKQTDMKGAAKASAEGALQLIDKLRRHPGFEGAVGMSLTPGFMPATDRKGAEAIVEQLKGQAFLNAIQQLRGLGALSDAEGAKLQQAAARLDTNQSEKDFKVALSDYEGIIKDAVKRLGGDSPASGPTESDAAARLRALRTPK